MTRRLDLFGEVSLFHDNGMTFVSESAEVDLAEGPAEGQRRSTVTVPPGRSSPKASASSTRESVIVFTGKASALLNSARETVRMKRLLAAALVALVPSFGDGAVPRRRADSGEGKPLKIEAERGIEWHQNEKAYVARGNALAARGDVSVRAEVLTAYYRAASRRRGRRSGLDEIHRVVAQGTVRSRRRRKPVFGDRAVYDVDQSVAVVTGDESPARHADRCADRAR